MVGTGRLFDLRDAEVHAKVKSLPSLPHPSGVSNAGQVHADNSAEEAVKAANSRPTRAARLPQLSIEQDGSLTA